MHQAAVCTFYPGSAYYQFQIRFIEQHCRLYDSAIEFIRDGCVKTYGVLCDFHARFNNPKSLQNGWSGIPLSRIPPSVPLYDEGVTEFHYAHHYNIRCGEIKEKFTLKASKVTEVESRSIDDYCPRTQLKRLFAEVGYPSLSHNEIHHDDGSITIETIDSNRTKEKIYERIDDFTDEFVGRDLSECVEHEVQKQ